MYLYVDKISAATQETVYSYVQALTSFVLLLLSALASCHLIRSTVNTSTSERFEWSHHRHNWHHRGSDRN